MDVLFLSRIQFALNICFHYLYPPISIGLGLMLVIMEGMYLKRGDLKYKEMTIVLDQDFCADLCHWRGDGTGAELCLWNQLGEVFAVCGGCVWKRAGGGGSVCLFSGGGLFGRAAIWMGAGGAEVHYLATICVCLGAHFSAVWIIVANSWMQTPAGHHIVQTATGPRAEIVDFWAMVFNPSSLDRLFHTVVACWLTGAFFVMSVAAYYLLRRKHQAIAKSMMRLSLWVAMGGLVLQLVSGDSSARLIAKFQPAKLAAFEGLYKTAEATPISV